MGRAGSRIVRRALFSVVLTASIGIIAGESLPNIASAHEPGVVRVVTIKDTKGQNPYGFSPKKLVITVGTRVVWRNQSSAPHTVTAKGEHPYFSSGTKKLIAPGHHWAFTFHKTGTFHYYCIVHPFMTGTVVVKKS
ncbi:MAG TPA: plastocyanin/azurin family copper-binding protein [Chloroflexota bacterium]|nr:plastocyanin/azurin family copper-binding protein [Chloroflexota bacterium]